MNLKQLMRNPEILWRKSKKINTKKKNPDSDSNITLPSTVSLRLPKDLFPSALTTKTLYAFLDSYIRATCPPHLSCLDLRFLIILREEYKGSGLALCNFLHFLIIYSLLATKYISKYFILEQP